MNWSLWSRRSALGLLLGMLLSLVMVTPSVAADGWVPDPDKVPAETKYKYGYDYAKAEGTGKSWTYKLGDKIPIPSSLNPSRTGPSVPFNGSNSQPLTGKIIQPGKTPVKPPSVYGPVTKFATALGGAGIASRLLPGLGFGIGGLATPPSNAVQIGQAQGIAQACMDDVRNCTDTDRDKWFKIGSCQHLTGASSCQSIGAVTPDGSPLGDWFANEALPFLEDLWAKITGQKTDTEPSDQHIEVTMTKGCYFTYGFEVNTGAVPASAATLKLHKSTDIVGPKPTNQTQAIYYDMACGASAQADVSKTNTAYLEVMCMDGLGKLQSPGGTNYGSRETITGSFFNADGTLKYNPCRGAAGAPDPSKVQLVAARVWNSGAASNYTGTGPGAWQVVKYSEWLHPSPQVDFIEDTKITTSWDCKLPNGTLYTFSKTITGTAAMVAPTCGPGADLVRHDVQVSQPGGTTQTVDSMVQNQQKAAQYPECVGAPCTLTIEIDGKPCVVGNADCKAWPAINSITPSRVVCKWGTYTMPTSDCFGISNGYQSETGVVLDPRSGAWTAVDAYGNPIQPNAQPWNPTNPNPQVGQQPGTVTPTTPGTGTGTGTGGFPTTGTSPSNDNCIAGMWTWNPVDWVFVPVKCALQWAFVPKQAVLDAKGQQIRTKLGELGIDAPIAAVESTVAALPQGGGCAGPTIVFSLRSVHQELQPLNACSEPMATVAMFANAAGSLYLVLFGSIAFVKALSGAFGYQWYFGGKAETSA